MIEIANQLHDPTNQLLGLANQLLEWTNQLNEGANQLHDQTNQLLDLANQLHGLTNQLNEGANQLDDRTKDVYKRQAFYAFVVENVDSLNNGLGSAGKFKANVNYSKLIESYTEKNGYEYYWDSIAQAPSLYNKQLRTFVTYDNKKSVSLKTKYAIDKKLGGIMFWKLNGDTYTDGLLDAIDNQIKLAK